MIWKNKSKKKPSYKGLDCSGEYVVMPPTFCGISELIRRAGSETAAAALYPDSNKDFEGEDVVRDFLQELEFTDKVERQGLIEEFADYVKSLEEQMSQEQQPPQEQQSSQEQQPFQESQKS